MPESRPPAAPEKLMIVIPTYNERENLRPVADAIWRSFPDAEILIVDDNSPDGTGTLAEQISEESGGRLQVLHRRGKEGLGRAYVAGFSAVAPGQYHWIVQMDADLSHEPHYIAGMIAAAEDADVVVGSRYVRGINVVNWDFKRLLLSKAATKYVNILTGLRMSDTTSGFKCWRADALARLPLDRVNASGYLFQIEMNLLAVRSGLRVKESPIIFYERERGRSKIDSRIIGEAILGTMRLALRHRFQKWFARPLAPAVQVSTGPHA